MEKTNNTQKMLTDIANNCELLITAIDLDSIVEYLKAISDALSALSDDEEIDADYYAESAKRCTDIALGLKDIADAIVEQHDKTISLID